MAKKDKPVLNTPVSTDAVSREPVVAQSIDSRKATNISAGTNGTYRKWFFISLAVMLGILWVSGFNLGLCSDEMDMNQYGKANYRYYFSGGKDTSFLNLHQDADSVAMKTLPFYGSNFEYLATGINYLTGNSGGRQEYNVRHMLNQLFVVLAILFTGLCAAFIKNYRAALIAGWLLFLTPTFLGWGMFDTKDLPFATGYIATLYFMLRFLAMMPKPSWKATIYLMLALAFTMGIRVGGLLLVAYFVAFVKITALSSKQMRTDTFRKDVLLQLALQVMVVIAGGLLITVLLWPYVIIDPVHNFMNAINSAKKFPADILMNFKGVEIRSTELPQNYLITYLTITIPVFILIAFTVSLILLSTSYRKIKIGAVALIAVAALFPIVYAIQSGMALYNGWRHILFFYPPFVLIAGLGMENIFDRVGKPMIQMAIGVICVAAMAHPIYWSFKNHPFEYMYYNETEGFNKAYYDFENDVWSISVRPAVDWLMLNEGIMTRKDTVTIGSNTAYFIKHHISTHYPGARVKVVAISGKSYWEYNWDYMLLNTVFLSTGYLQSDYPPEGTIQTVDADGHPLTAIVKDTRHLQYQTSKAILSSDFRKADSLINIYLATSKKMNPYFYGSIAITKARNNNFTDGLSYGKKALEANPNDFFAHAALSFICYKQNNIEEAVNHINDCLSIAPEDPFVLQLADSISAKIPK